ncbi:MAG: hypothetical protein OSB00_06610 [Sphingomonas bacterium]|nr:hypothetical protein [Sphingomonas bacterium]
MAESKIQTVPNPSRVGSDTSTLRRDPNRLFGKGASVIRAAALGDLGSQRDLRAACYHRITAPAASDVWLVDLAMIEGLVLARLCAAHGDETDARALAAYLLLGASIVNEIGTEQFTNLAENYGAEALSILEDLACVGDEEAAVNANSLIALLPPQVLEKAQRLSRLEVIT